MPFLSLACIGSLTYLNQISSYEVYWQWTWRATMDLGTNVPHNVKIDLSSNGEKIDQRVKILNTSAHVHSFIWRTKLRFWFCIFLVKFIIKFNKNCLLLLPIGTCVINSNFIIFTSIMVFTYWPWTKSFCEYLCLNCCCNFIALPILILVLLAIILVGSLRWNQNLQRIRVWLIFLFCLRCFKN